MSNNSQIDKDRLFFTQNYKPIRLRCPECVRNSKILRHCRIFKNLAALGWHLKREHSYISNLLFNSEELYRILNVISKAIDLKIITEPSPVYVESTTTSSLQYRDRPPRKDVWEKLENVSSFLINQSKSWPIFSVDQVRLAIKMSLKNADARTIKHYLDCIIDASEKNQKTHTIDVTQFCSEFESGV